jgi:uracil-DNA glycosylase family 4
MSLSARVAALRKSAGKVKKKSSGVVRKKKSSGVVRKKKSVGVVRKTKRAKIAGAARKKKKCVAAAKTVDTTLARPLIAPDPEEAKSGCLWCPLAPFHKDFDTFKDAYCRDADKIVTKEKDPYTIKTRGIVDKPWKKVRVLFIGSTPGAKEDTKGLPFVGKSGDIIRMAATEGLDVSPEEVAYTNVVRCRPPRNRDPRKTEVKCCSYELMREIKARQPEVIVVLDNYSMEFLCGQAGITMFAGHFMKSTHPEWKNKDVLACFHPAYIMRFDYHAEKFAETFVLLNTYLNGSYEPLVGSGNYKTLTDLEDVRKLLIQFRKAEKVTFDTETGSLSPFDEEFPKLLCLSFSDKPGVGYTIPYDHADSPWCMGGPKECERPKLKKLLRDFFVDESIPKVAQNEKFDRKHIRKNLGRAPRGILRDTMLTHLVLDERRGTHGLKKLAFLYTGMGGYERPLELYIKSHKECDPKKGGSYANIPGKILFPYAGMDTDVTYRVDDGLIAEAEYQEDAALRRLSEIFLPQLSVVLSDLEYTGVQVDSDVVKKLDTEYRAKMAKYKKQIAKLPRVRAFVASQIKAGKTGKKKGDIFQFNPGSATQLRKVLFDYYKLQPVELTDSGLSRLGSRYAKLNAARKRQKQPAIGFTEVVQQAVEKKEWEYFTTKADVLHEYERQGNNLSPLILKYRKYETLYGTFVKPLLDRLDKWGRVHCSFLPHGTVTGRLSSADPNNQNIPRAAKPVYVSRFGDEGVILNADYSQIELRIAASWFHSPKMLEAYRNGVDLHAQTAADIAGMTLEAFMALPEKKRKEMRTKAKRVNFGIIYGIGPPGLVGTLKKDGVHMTVDETSELIDNYFSVRPGLKQGIEDYQAEAAITGILTSFTGRKRRLPEVFSSHKELASRALRQSINFPIQSGASDMTLMSLVLIHRIMQSEGFKSKIVLTVHDSIVFDCHVDEVLEIAKIAKDVMQNLPELSEEVLPGLDWSWLTVPIVADFEVGHSWGSLVGFDPDAVMAGGKSDEAMYKKKNTEIARDPVNVDELWDQMEFKAKKVA